MGSTLWPRTPHPAMAAMVGILMILANFLTVGATDLQCLLAFKASVLDPESRLANWKINASSVDGVCNWNGVSCFSHNALPVYQLLMQNFGLSGTWPIGLGNCTALQKLDLSDNAFTGPIPSTIAINIPNLVYLDLSNNKLGGSIPGELADCKYLNDLFLQDNQLEGEIPGQIGTLERLVGFDVSNNKLSGIIPSTFGNKTANRQGFNASSFEGNTYLCGAPLTGPCKKPKGSSANIGVIIGAAVGALVVLAVVSGLLLWYVMRKARTADAAVLMRSESKWAKQIRKPKTIIVSMFEKPIVRIKLTDLMLATNDFSKDNIIGIGRTGTVYRAAFPDGSVMAIKRLQVSSQSDRQFRAEMETLGHLRHRNLVPLLGFCIAGGERLLVYKHMPNGSVADRLHSVSGKANPLDWADRVKIATGGARGLAWLHHTCNPRVIHRNISASAILLDDDNEPRITDFGLARLMNPVDTHISTFVNGDFGDVGYVAPEYIRTLVATTKGDVFSFGVVLLELVTGQKPVDVVSPLAGDFKGNLVDYVLMLSNTGRMSDGVDPIIKDKGVDDEIMQIFKVASSCVLLGAKERPTMFEVHQLLRAIGQKYNYTDPFDDLPAIAKGDADQNEVIVSVK